MHMRNAATIVAALNTSSVIVRLMKTARDKKQLNGKEGMAMMKGAQTPPTMTSAIKGPQKEAQGA